MIWLISIIGYIVFGTILSTIVDRYDILPDADPVAIALFWPIILPIGIIVGFIYLIYIGTEYVLDEIEEKIRKYKS